MKSCAKAIVLLHNQQAKRSGLLQEVHHFLQERSCDLQLIAIEEIDSVIVDPKRDLAIVLGGDGTILHASIWLEPLRIPLLAIHAGTLGFLAEHGVEHWHEVVEAFIEDRLPIMHHPLLKIALYKDGVLEREFLAINEVIVASSSRKLSTYQVEIDQSGLIQMRAEGIAIAMPVGSTGYTLAMGGPIITPKSKVFLLQAIAAFDLSARSLVVSQEERITIMWQDLKDLSLMIDGRAYELQQAKSSREVVVSLAQETTIWATSQESSAKIYYQALHDKLGWFTLSPGAKSCYRS